MLFWEPQAHPLPLFMGTSLSHLLGAIAAPVDPLTPATRLEYISTLVSPKAIFIAQKPSGCTLSVHNINELACCEAIPKVESVFTKPDNPADILFTTGTTGDPKGVVLSHKSILCAANNINTFIRNTNGDREVVPLPLSHSFGLGRLRCNLLSGSTIILVDGITFPAKIFKAFEQWDATGFASVPAGLVMLLRMTKDRIGSYAAQLRYLEIGSAPMFIEDKRRLMNLLPDTRICMHYGLTEASRSAFIEFHESSNFLDSIGKASPNVEIKIVDDNDHELGPHRSGKIMVRGGTLMTEYWHNAKATREVLNSDWLYTGDYGYKDANDYLYLERVGKRS